VSPKGLHGNDEHFLARFFETESVSIVGASNNPTRPTTTLSPICSSSASREGSTRSTPSEKEIQGLKAYPAVKELPETVDLAVIGVSYAMTPAILKQCVDMGIQAGHPHRRRGFRGRRAREKVQAEMARMVREKRHPRHRPQRSSPINVKAGFCISFHPWNHQGRRPFPYFQSGLYEPRSGWLLTISIITSTSSLISATRWMSTRWTP